MVTDIAGGFGAAGADCAQRTPGSARNAVRAIAAGYLIRMLPSVS